MTAFPHYAIRKPWIEELTLNLDIEIQRIFCTALKDANCSTVFRMTFDTNQLLTSWEILYLCLFDVVFDLFMYLEHSACMPTYGRADP